MRKLLLILLLDQLVNCFAIKCYNGIYMSHIDKSAYAVTECQDYCLVAIGGLYAF